MTIKTWFPPSVVEKYRSEGYWPDMTPADIMVRNADNYPDKIAFTDVRGHYTWKQIDERSSSLAAAFIEAGLKKEDRVVSQLPNWAEFFLVRYAAEKSGVIALNAMINLRAKELEFIINSVEASAVIIPWQFGGTNVLEIVEEVRPTAPSLKHIFIAGPNVPTGYVSLDEIVSKPAPARYTREYFRQFRIPPWEVSGLYMTSGTTGVPKFVMAITGSQSTVAQAEMKRQRLTPDDVLLACAPIPGGPSGTLCNFTAPWVPCRVVLQEKFDPAESLRLIQDEKVTLATGVPAQIVMMLNVPTFEKYDLSSLRAFFYAGAVLPTDVAQQASKRMGCRIITVYGMLDAGIPSGTSVDDSDEVEFRTVGKPLPGCEVKLADDNGNAVPAGEIGEVVWRGPATHSAGYWRDPEATEKAFGNDGWFATGDVGAIDAEGNLSIVGRKKDIIIRGGQNISPIEIEEILITHAKVLDVAVVAMPDKVMGEKACAFVIPKPNQQFTFEELVSFLKEKRMASYKLPERLEIIDAFPMSGGGQKIAKNVLRDIVANKLKEEGKI